MSMVSLLSHHIRTCGPIATARVSSAQARGRAKRYAYWGVARYEVRLTADGAPTNAAMERAGSDRRSVRLAERDCDDLCEREGRLRCQRIGRLTECDAYDVAIGVPTLDAAIQTYRRRCAARHADSPLTLAERLMVHHLMRGSRPGYGRYRAAVIRAVREGKFGRKGRWIIGAGYGDYTYVPFGDSRDADEFSREQNHSLRRLIHEACGDRCLPPAELVQMDDYGRLMRSWDGDLAVHVVCPSTGAQYVLPVSRRCRTAKEAVAETFGLREVEYSPAQEA